MPSDGNVLIFQEQPTLADGAKEPFRNVRNGRQVQANQKEDSMTEEEFKATIVKALEWMEDAQETIHGEWGGSGPDPEILAMRQVVSMMTGEPMKVDEPPEPVERPPEVVYPNRDEEVAKIIAETDPAEVGGIMALIVEAANLRARSAPFFDQGRLDYLEKLLLLARKKDAMG